MALTLTVTDAGRAALRNAQGNGTNAVLVASVGVTATAFISGQALPNEIKRISTIAGGATAADTIHVTVSDTGTDVYSVRGFAFYLADGTLFGSYGQADVIVEKSAQATMMMAVDVKFAAIDASQITFGDSNFSNPAATTETHGVVRLANDAEAIAGADAQKALTAKNLLAALNDRLGFRTGKIQLSHFFLLIRSAFKQHRRAGAAYIQFKHKWLLVLQIADDETLRSARSLNREI